MNAKDPRQQLRREMRQQRNALTPLQRMQASAAVAAVLKSSHLVASGSRVALYWAVQGELPLLDCVHMLNSIGCALHLPVIRDDSSLRFAAWRHGEQMQANRFGIPEPAAAENTLREGSELDLILMPLVAFDRAGNRLGSGAGFYDRSFAFLNDGERPRAPRLVGIGYALQEVDALSTYDWDVCMDHVVTERELIVVAPHP